LGYLIKAILGAGLFIGGTLLFNIKLIELLEVGTCASGNQPFEIARQCPEGTETDVLLMAAAIIGGLIGAFLFALRGDPPWGSGRRAVGAFSWATFAWGVFFAGSGAVILISSLNDSSLPGDSQLGGTIVGITFLVMGVPALLFALWVMVTNLGDRDERPSGSTRGGGPAGGPSIPSLSNAMGGLTWGSRASGSGSGGDDSIAKLERLQKLRDSGALTETEFEREKAKVLSEMR
jgi:Short C-terminal domain